MKKLLLIFFLALSNLFANNNDDTTYSVQLKISLSPLISFFRDERYPGGPKNAAPGYGTFIRVMWHPGRMLKFGLMTGYMLLVRDEFKIDNISKELSEKASARLAAIPLQVGVLMQAGRTEFGLGMGPYLMLTTIDYGTVAKGKRFELGLTFLGSYVFPVSDLFSLGPELRVLYLSYRGIVSIMPSMTFHLEILRY
jgi:hypothetical protein